MIASESSIPGAGTGGLSAEEVSALVARAQLGEVAAFEPLYRAFSGRIYALCLRMAGNRVEAGELLQDVFVRCWQRIGSFEGRSSFGTWLHRLAVNVVLSDRRSRGRRRARETTTGDLERFSAAAREQMPDRDIDLERAIRALPPKARRVFVLHDIEGYRHDEIAEMTGSAPGTLRAHLHRARRILREKLS